MSDRKSAMRQVTEEYPEGVPIGTIAVKIKKVMNKVFESFQPCDLEFELLGEDVSNKRGIFNVTVKRPNHERESKRVEVFTVWVNVNDAGEYVTRIEMNNGHEYRDLALTLSEALQELK